eukprot:jgi/Chrzof1/7048/Cz02g08240.t1
MEKFTQDKQQDLLPSLQAAEVTSPKLTVCVTGATGYVAAHIVKRLLAGGHTVHGTTRDPHNRKTVAPLQQLPGASQRLKLFKADLLVPGSFDAAVDGCDAVIHTASPFELEVPAGKEAELMIEPAVSGTENVLNSVNKASSVKRVVLTSSIVAVFGDPHERGKGHKFTEADWDLIATPKTHAYFYSKLAAERRAYEMNQQSNSKWVLCSINPGAVWGPPLTTRLDSESVNQCRDLLSGALWPWAPPLGTAVVDVRDVALAHCLALVIPSAQGRYIVTSESTFLMPTAAKILRHAYPHRWIPPLKPPLLPLLVFGPMLGLPRAITKASYRKKPNISTSKAAKDLGLTTYIPLKQTVLEMADTMIQNGMVPRFGVPKATPIILGYLVLFALVIGFFMRNVR